jgi:protein gp37
MGDWRGGRRFEDVRVHDDRVELPLRWRKPARVFVNSMSDLFHEDVPDEFIWGVWGVMHKAAQHTFLVLTKRPDRMRDVLRVIPFAPAPNVHLGVSVEDQAAADERIPILLDTPAAVRWISAEPLLGPVDVSQFLRCDGCGYTAEDKAHHGDHRLCHDPTPALDWIVVGGESGPDARLCDVRWIRSLVAQGREAGVPVFVKQLGARSALHEFGKHDPWCDRCNYGHHGKHGVDCTGPRHPKGGDPAEWPDDLRVREFPNR